MPKKAIDAVKPHLGSKHSKALIITTRIPLHLQDSLVVRPQLLNEESLDLIFEKFVAEKYGQEHFKKSQKDIILQSIKVD